MKREIVSRSLDKTWIRLKRARKNLTIWILDRFEKILEKFEEPYGIFEKS